MTQLSLAREEAEAAEVAEDRAEDLTRVKPEIGLRSITRSTPTFQSSLSPLQEQRKDMTSQSQERR